MYAGGRNLIGRNLSIAQTGRRGRIVGTIGNMIEDGPSAPAAPYVYVCMPAGGWPDPEYVVRTQGDPQSSDDHGASSWCDRSTPRVRCSVFAASTSIIGESLDQPRLNARFLTAFAGAALALAALGLYGLLTLLVADRREELGVRIALGASSGDLVRLVLAGAGRLIALGIAAGLILMFAASQALRSLLFGVTTHDARALAGGVLALAIVSLLAIAIPARQAAKISPMEALR